eukprot:SAG31_NODE_2833_length_5023_cov_2.514216_2_plen_36_part_00
MKLQKHVFRVVSETASPECDVLSNVQNNKLALYAK